MHIHSTIFPIRVSQSCVAEVERLTRHRPGAAVPVVRAKKGTARSGVEPESTLHTNT
jgi:pyruvoyl-dependent arginine decarboxylase (PvlArgDC)